MSPAKAVSTICYQADRITRQDLSLGAVISERDYMSVLSSRIRDAWQPFGSSYAYSATLPGGMEQAFGCDTLLVVHDDLGAKLCLIEAKWPRIATKPNYRWDKLQKQKGKSSKQSHFTQQLERQRLILPDAVVAEMFLFELPPGALSSVFDQYGSTIVLHEDAYGFDTTRRKPPSPWSNYELWELMGFTGSRKMNLGQLVLRLAECSLGTPLPIASGQVTVANGRSTISIPTSLDRLSEIGPEICRHLGVANLISLHVRWMG